MAKRRFPGDDASPSGETPGVRAAAAAPKAPDASDAITATAAVSLIQAVEDPSAVTEVMRRTPTNPAALGKRAELSAARRAPLPDPSRRALFGLRLKFNAVLAFAFGVGLALAAVLADRILEENAREEVLQNARIMLESASSARAYTADHIKPLLESQLADKFLPETVSAYAATQIFLSLRGKFPEYTYKEAALNPRNPANRASDWEADIVEEFRNHPDQAEKVTERATPGGRMLHLARPLRVDDEGCLACHSTLERAPRSMLEIYGTNNGFGWKLDEVVGAQVVTVPMSVPMSRARETLKAFLLLLAGVFALLLVLMNVLLHFIVIQPVVRMARAATDVSMGKADVPEYVLQGHDEIASLSQSFVRMRRSLENAMKMLGE